MTDDRLDSARGAQRGEVPSLGQAGPKRFLLEHVDAVLGGGLDDSPSHMVGDGDYHEVELLGGEHLAEVGVASDAVLVALLPEQVRVLVADGGQDGDVVVGRLPAQPHDRGPQTRSGPTGDEWPVLLE